MRWRRSGKKPALPVSVDDYLSKPVFLEDLEAALSRLLLDEEDAAVKVISSNLRPAGSSAIII